MREMQGAEDEDEGSILKYVTETEFRKQRSRLRIFTHRPLFLQVNSRGLGKDLNVAMILSFFAA